MKAEIYSKDNCTYCVQAKALLAEQGIEYDEIDALGNREKLIERVTNDTGNAPLTLPQIYIDGEYVGGFKELAARLG